YGDNNHFVIARRQSEQRVAAGGSGAAKEKAQFGDAAFQGAPAWAAVAPCYPSGEDVGTADGAAFAAVLSAGSALGCGVTGVAMPSNSETVTNLKPLASSSSKVEGIASIVPG